MKNPFESFFEDAASVVSNAANEAKKAAVNVASNVADSVAPVANEAEKVISETASNVANTVMPIANAPLKAVSEIPVVEAVAKTASEAASAVSGAVEKGVSVIKENSFSERLKRWRFDGFKDGINQGAYLAGQKRWNFYYAYVATLCFFLRCDNEFSEEERKWLEESLDHLRLEGGIPDEVRDRLHEIADNEDLSFEEIAQMLNEISLVSLEAIVDNVAFAVELDGVVAEEEREAQQLLRSYVNERMGGSCEDEDSWTKRAIDESIAEYSENYDRINEEFKEMTRLQDKDIAFLLGATMLQVARVFVINYLTGIESAGVGNKKEKVLHGAQDKLFENIGRDESINADRLYAPLHQILSPKCGVPYDVTNANGELPSLFRGANHRFSTLGHDPLLGLIFGTSNILTNTITCVNDKGFLGTGIGVPSTYLVDYAIGYPVISSEQAGTIEMLIKSTQRIGEEPEAAAAALIKQLIHIGTDLYTPCGIQLPFANIILNKSHADKLSRYVSTGDVLKVGAQAGLTLFINWLIAALHGSSLIFNEEDEDFSMETYQIRTKKILLISDAIATSSSVIQAAITKNPKCLDLGGAAVLIYRLFTDTRFITKVKEDYINTGLNSIYEERAKGIL